MIKKIFRGPFTVTAGSINRSGFKTLDAAKKHAKRLYSDGLLFGRHLRITDSAGYELVSFEVAAWLWFNTPSPGEERAARKPFGKKLSGARAAQPRKQKRGVKRGA